MVKGSDLVVSLLAEAGVKHVFALTGTSILDLMDSMSQQGEIEYVGVRHEAAAAHMADGYARATGKPGVCMSHVGPGALNMLYGVATARKDSSPVVAITGNEVSHGLGKDLYHEMDVLALYRPVTKWQGQCLRVREVPRLLRNAFVQAVTGRPGPVHIDVPKDVAQARCEQGEEEGGRRDSQARLGFPAGGAEVPALRPLADKALVEEAASLLTEAERPIILAGGGVLWSGAWAELKLLAERLEIPVATTETGRGAFPEEKPHFIGFASRYVGYGSTIAALRDSDLLLGVGLTFSNVSTMDWSVIGPRAKVIQVDIDPHELGRQIPVELAVLADARAFLAALLGELEGRRVRPGPGRRKRLEELSRTYHAEREDFFKAGPDRARCVKPQRVISMTMDVIRPDAFVGIGNGLHTCFVTRLPIHTPRTYLRSGGFGAMGFAFPATMGAKVAHPERQAVVLLGDGDFAMSMHELETAVRHRLGVVAVVFNNFSFGSQKLHQRRSYGERYIGSDHGNPDFGALARLFGARGARIDNEADFLPALEEMLKAEGPAVLDVIIDTEETSAKMSSW